MSSTIGFNIPSTNNKTNRTNHNKENKTSNIQKEREIQTFIKPHLFSLIQLNGLTLQCAPVESPSVTTTITMADSDRKRN